MTPVVQAAQAVEHCEQVQHALQGLGLFCVRGSDGLTIPPDDAADPSAQPLRRGLFGDDRAEISVDGYQMADDIETVIILRDDQDRSLFGSDSDERINGNMGGRESGPMLP